MNNDVIRSMLLLDEPNISGLRHGIENYAKGFLAVSFISALTWEFFTEMRFIVVVKNLVLALIFMGCFYEFHTKAVDLSLKTSEELLREVSPRNIFLRKWTEVKVKTTDSSQFNFIEKIAIPNLNDLLGTALFLMSKVCILILKLIYTTVYHFTYIFAPITAVLSLLPLSKSSMAGTITSSLWCVLLPFVLVVFLALVGNSIQIPAANGQFAISSMDQLIWIFGMTLLMLLAPSFTFMLIKGSIASTADSVGVKMTEIGAKALVSLPMMHGLGQKVLRQVKKTSPNLKTQENKAFPDRMSNLKVGNSSNSHRYQNSLKEKGGLNFERSSQRSVKVSEMKMNSESQKNNSIHSHLSNSLGNDAGVRSLKKSTASSRLFNLGKNTNPNPNKNDEIKAIMKTSPRSNHSSKDTPFFKLNSSAGLQLPTQSPRNIFKQNQLPRKTEIRPKFGKIKISNLRKFNPKEKKDEI